MHQALRFPRLVAPASRLVSAVHEPHHDIDDHVARHNFRPLGIVLESAKRLLIASYRRKKKPNLTLKCLFKGRCRAGAGRMRRTKIDATSTSAAVADRLSPDGEEAKKDSFDNVSITARLGSGFTSGEL